MTKMTTSKEQIEAISKQYDAINDMIVAHSKDIARDYIRRGEEVPPEVYKLAKTTARSFEMEEKLNRMSEDPVAYFAEVRKQAKQDADRETREEFLRPLKKILDWFLGRR